MSRCVPTPPITANNQGNFTRWMGAENPPSDWYHLCNPLNCGLDDGSTDGTGSYPNLDFAATETANVLSQSNMRPILQALLDNASTAVFSAGCAASAWSTGGYHGQPGYIASVPQEAVIGSPYTFPSVGPSPAPTPTPTPTPVPSTSKETNMLTKNTGGQGYWGVRPNASVYAFEGAPYIGPHATWSASWGIGTATNPVVGIAADGQGGFALLCDGADPSQPHIYDIPADGQYASPKP